MGGILELINRLGPQRLAAMGAVTLALIGFFIYIAIRASSPAMVPLFTDLPLTDSAAVVKSLEAQGVKYELKGDGATVLIPREAVATVRMKLAEAGLPTGGGVGWEIFDKGDGLSATSFLQNVNRLRALEGELSRSIRALDRVTSARVHLVVPERPLFSKDAPKPSASIVLRVRGGFGQSEIRAVRHLVASAVQGLEPSRISIVDESGRLLADGAGENADGLPAGAAEREAQAEKRLKDQVEGIVERIVGPGRARAEVRAEFDYSKVTQTADSFDPESRVVRSTQTRNEQNNNRDVDQSVSAGNQVPNAQQQNGGGRTEQGQKSEEVVNYEISRTTRTEVLEGARLKRISLAVLVDGVYTTDPQGAVSYQPRSQEELDRIAALVRSAIGFSQNRGDQVEVVNLRFAEPPPIKPGEEGLAFLGFTKDDIVRLAELGILGIITLIVLLVAVRPLIKNIIAPLKSEQPETLALPAPDGETPALTGPEGEHAEGEPGTSLHPEEATRLIEMAQVNGKVQAQSVQRVGELAQRNPTETLAIIRQWLAEPAQP